MSHYTLNSGKQTDTITSRCPHCLKVRYHQVYSDLNDITVCCSNMCYTEYIDKLYILRDKALAWAKLHNVLYNYEGEIITKYMEQTDTL